jgi:hypothetical protein
MYWNARSNFVTTLSELKHKQLWTWLEEYVPEDKRATRDFGVLKAVLQERGVNSRGWRLYLDYGDAIFENLGKPWVSADWVYTSRHNAIAFLRLLQGCEMDVLPPTALLRSMPSWLIPQNRICHIPTGFFRAAWKMCIVGEYTGTPIETIIESRIIPVCQWYFATKQHAKPDANLLKAGWAALEKRHIENLPVGKADDFEHAGVSPKKIEWITPIQRAEVGMLRYIALSSPSALDEEGQEMNHCIGNYDQKCRSSSLRAFSVRDRKSDEPIATLTVFFSSQSRSWQFDQIHGPGNAKVNQRVVEASVDLLHFLDEVTRADVVLQREMKRLGQVRQSNDQTFDDFSSFF